MWIETNKSLNLYGSVATYGGTHLVLTYIHTIRYSILPPYPPPHPCISVLLVVARALRCWDSDHTRIIKHHGLLMFSIASHELLGTCGTQEQHTANQELSTPGRGEGLVLPSQQR
jgi:hypothetical protein